MVDIPSGSGANKGFWEVQLRDKYGKFVEMGGAVMFEIQLEGVQGKSTGVGYFIGNLDLETARIEVRDNKKIPKGIYLVNRKDITALEAILPEDYVEEKTREALGEAASDLLSNISGDEALKIRMKSVAKALKDEGRFPIPRQGSLTEIGKTSDISKGARLDYQKVFDAEPALQERFKTFENMWEYVYTNGTDLTTQSPNDLAEIPEDMKLLNRAYAKHVLNLDPDGFLTVYRNAVNGKDTESESAVGYVSLDRQMAWDYNSTRENIGANGRYEIDVKPEEVYGLLGYSRIEDEYGLTIGRGVTEQEGRVRRVGDLEPAKLAPWLEEWNNSFKRQQGSSPLRGFGVAGEYDFHEVEDFGENLQDFLAKHNLEASDISAKFDQLYGEGSYARYKESGNTVNYALVRKMFVKLDNGNLGLNAEYLDSFATLKPNAEYKDDQFDNVMKMLSVFQELTGQPFMTHKTRDYSSGPQEAVKPEPKKIKQPKPSERKREREALGWYTDNGYWDANKFLREGVPLDTPEDEENLAVILQMIDESVTTEDMTLYRGRPVKSEERAAALAALKPGDKITDRGIMSTSEDKERAEFYAETPLKDVRERVFFEIDLPAGSKALKIEDTDSSFRGEYEVLLPPNTEFTIQDNVVDDAGVRRIKVKVLTYVGEDVPEPESALPPVLQNELNIIKMIQSLGQSPEDLTQGEVDAVEKYRGFKRENQDLFFYEKLNAYLRYKEQRGPDAPDYSTEVANLDSVLEKFEGLPEDTIVYRGVGGRSKRYQNLKVGDEISDAGYTSTSLNEGVAWGFATGDDGADEYLGFLIEIRLPKGTKVIEPIAATEADPEGYFRKRAEESKDRALTSTEREFILPRGSKFKVLERIDEPEDSFETDTPTRFILELVPPTSTESDLDQDSPTIYDEFFDGGMVDLRALRDSESRVSPYDLDMFSSDQVRALEWYGQAGHRSINKILRGGESISTKDQELIDNIDAAIEENGQVFSAARIFRGDTPSQSSNYYKFLEGLTEGKIVNFPGYFSASNDAQIAFSEFGPGQGGSDDDASNSHLSSTFFWSIDIPENGKAMAMPEGLGYGQGAESEVILPRNTQLKIIGLKKVEQLDDEGSPTGNYNYFIHAGQQIGATVSEPEPATQSVVSYPDRDHFDVPALTPKNIDETLALSYYTGETKKYVNGHKIINTYLRTGKHYDGVNSPETQAYVLKQIDALQKLVNSQTIDKNLKTFRYQEEVPEGLKAGDVWSSSGFLSTSTSTTMQGDQIVETEFASLPVQMEVNIPAGFRGGAVDTTLGRDEGEVLLPPGSKFVVQSIEKVDEKTKISLILVEQDEWVESESSRAATENAKQIALSLDKQYILRFLDRVGPQLGSNDGGTYKDSITGKEYYVKTPKSEEHRRNEMLASALYNLTNIGSAGVRFGSDANGVEKTYSAIISGKTLAETDITAETKKEIQDGFAIDAWLANWDVAGLEDDNIIINNDGKPYRIDTGGALLFRAQGAPKGEAFGDEVTEIDTLRDPNRNPASAALFGDMTYSDLVASASKLLDVSPEDIDILVDATFDEPLATQLKNKLKARRISILKRFDLLGSIA